MYQNSYTTCTFHNLLFIQLYVFNMISVDISISYYTPQLIINRTKILSGNPLHALLKMTLLGAPPFTQGHHHEGHHSLTLT